MLLAVPYLAAYVRSVDDGWNASNDDALIALRVHDVLAGEWPRLGQPSTAEHYAGTETLHHPGPIEFYLMAPAVALLGADLAMPLVAGAINLSAVLLTAWIVLRRAGPKVALGAAPLLALIAWAQGPVQLVDPISSNVGGIALLALAALAWAVVDGDVRLLPLAALAFAFVAQQHLAVVGLAGGMLTWTGVGVVLAILAWRRLRSGAGGPAPWPWLAGALAVTAVAWAPVLVDQLVGTGNLGRILTFAGASERPTLGWGAGVRQAVRAVGVPPLVLRTDLTGDDLHVALSPLSWAAAAAVLAGLVAVVVSDRVRRPARAWLAATVLVLVGFGVVTGSNVPSSVEAARLNLYRWTFVVSVLTWVVLGWAAASLVARRGVRSPGVRPALGVVGVALVAIAVAAVVGSGPTVWRDQEVFVAEEELSEAVRRELHDGARVLVVPVGRSAEFAVVPALAVDLVEAGHDIGVPPGQEAGYGSHLVASGRYDAGIVVVSGVGEANEWPGRLIARVDLNAATVDARATLADQLRGRDLAPTARADEVLASLMGSASGPPAQLFATYLEELPDDPEQVLRHPLVSRALQAGYFGDLGLDDAALELLVANPPVHSWNDDVIEVRRLTPEELERHHAAVMATGIGRPQGGATIRSDGVRRSAFVTARTGAVPDGPHVG